ncbi:MAG: M23 family metallopeptidase, partial [Clostridia bacterium]|nr:M23 family metallopeptidase [Clostridia bacterium]
EYYDQLGIMHYGTDIARSGGAPIVAAQKGKVISAGWSTRGYGNYVQIDHGKGEDGKRYVTLYGHLKSIYVKVGDTVQKGQEIGYMGNTGFSTGTHLHFEIIQNGAIDCGLQDYDGDITEEWREW